MSDLKKEDLVEMLDLARQCQQGIHGIFERKAKKTGNPEVELDASELSLVVSLQLNLDKMLMDILQYLIDESD